MDNETSYNDGMKIGKLAINLVKIKCCYENGKKFKHLTYDDKYQPRHNIPYIEDNNNYHRYDLYYPPKDVKKKNCLIIDIHGGGYIFGHRHENYNFGTVFLDAGFDFIAIDYVPNNGRGSINDIVDQCVKCIIHIIDHLEDYGFSKDYPIVLTGDSAGGHLASTITELICDKEYQKELGYDIPSSNLKALLINCPVFDFIHLGDDYLTNSGKKRLFGPTYADMDKRALIDPIVHIDSLKVPFFVSSTKTDFIRTIGAETAVKAMEGRKNAFEYLYIDDDFTGHVHNILDITTPESKKVNQAMIDFIDRSLK